jgi:hypothetical protein
VSDFRTPWPLGRMVPKDWKHVERYPLLMEAGPLVAPITVNRTIPIPAYRQFYDQGAEGACVGFSSSWCMSILNRRKYNARWLWNRAKEIDEWPETNPGDDNGTSVRAGMDVLRSLGHVWRRYNKDLPPNPSEGIAENRWARTVDEIRVCIAAKVPVVLGVSWYENFDVPMPRVVGKTTEWWIGRGNLGSVRGGHAIVCRGASDRRQAFKLTNSWGLAYPDVWVPYETVQRLLDEYGEATVIVDRI